MADIEKIQAQRKRIGLLISLGETLFLIPSTAVIPTRAPLIVACLAGNTVAAAKTLAAMTSLGAAVELLVSPVFGKLSDAVGRRRLMLVAPCTHGCLHLLVGLFPGNLPLNFFVRARPRAPSAALPRCAHSLRHVSTASVFPHLRA